MLNVDSLKRGIVIDHIKAGSCMDIYKYLELDKLDCSVAIIKNAKSNAMGKKKTSLKWKVFWILI